MKVTFEHADPMPQDELLKHLNAQYAKLQADLMRMSQESQQTHQRHMQVVMESMAKQQDALLEALRHVMGAPSAPPAQLKPAPLMKVEMPAEFSNRMSQLETVIADGFRKSRPRTFGSNF